MRLLFTFSILLLFAKDLSAQVQPAASTSSGVKSSAAAPKKGVVRKKPQVREQHASKDYTPPKVIPSAPKRHEDMTLDELQNAVDSGKDDALFELANRLAPSGYDKAFPLYLQSYTKTDNYLAAFKVGYSYSAGLGTPVIEKKVMTYMNPGIAKDYGPANLMAGLMYQSGTSVTKDLAIANTYFKKAFENINGKINTDAWEEMAMGMIYLMGSTVPQNTTAGIEWLTKSSDHGCVFAQYMIANWYKKNDALKKAFDTLNKVASAGLRDGQNDLALAYENGQGVEQNFESAFYWCNKSAIQGYGKGQYNLGRYYERGIGTSINTTEAIAWYQKAAKGGHTEAKEALARLTK